LNNSNSKSNIIGNAYGIGPNEKLKVEKNRYVIVHENEDKKLATQN
jgi:hypothetical protein